MTKDRRAAILSLCFVISVLTERLEPCGAATRRRAATKDQFAEGIAPVLAADVPEIGLAAYKGDITTLRRLVSSGTNIESAGKDNRTPLVLAAAGCHYDAVKILLQAGAKINARGIGRGTALHWAATKGDEKIARLLLSHHAEVNMQNEMGQTALICAAEVGSKHIVEALIAAGANRDLADEDGHTASWWAKRNKYEDVAVLLNRTRE